MSLQTIQYGNCVDVASNLPLGYVFTCTEGSTMYDCHVNTDGFTCSSKVNTANCNRKDNTAKCGTWTSIVYKTKSKAEESSWDYKGCFKDNSSRMIPHYLG